MFHLKLIKARSFSGVVHATAERPDVYVDDAATAKVAVETGYFSLCQDGTPDAPPTEAPTGTLNAIDAMNVTQLRAYIKKNSIAVEAPAGTSAADLRAAIAAAQAEKAAEDEEDPAAQFTGHDEDPAGGSGEPEGTTNADTGSTNTTPPTVPPTGTVGN